MLSIKNLSKSFGKKIVLDNLSLQADTPEIIAIVGENGSGKTTLFKIICGLLKSDNGTVKLGDGTGVSALIEYPNFFPYLTGRQNLSVLPKGNADRVEELIERFGLSADIDIKVSKYSLGMKQKLALIFVLSRESKIVLLDELTNSLDPQSIEIMKEVILEERNNGKLIAVSSHNLYFLDGFADRTFLLKNKNLRLISDDNKEYVFTVDNLEDCVEKLRRLFIDCVVDKGFLRVSATVPISEIVKAIEPFGIKSFSRHQTLSNLYLEAIDESGD